MFYWIIWMREFSTMISLLKSLVFPSFLLFLLWFCIYIENKIFLYSYHRIYFRSVMLDFWMLEKHKVRSILKEFLKPLKNWPHFCIFDASSTEISPSHSNPACNTIPMLFYWENWIVQLACSITLRISMFMIFWYKIIK